MYSQSHVCLAANITIWNGGLLYTLAPIHILPPYPVSSRHE